MTLGYAALPRLPDAVRRPERRAPPPIGIVHFGPGAFHRAHQASYIDTLLAHDPRWGIAAVALRSAGTIDALAAQQGLYTVAVRDAEAAYRVVGAHGGWLAPGDAAATHRLLVDPAVRLVTMTVTEKGYCLAGDGTLDFNHPDIAADISAEAAPVSVIGWVVAGLAARRAAGIAAFTVMPCDNQADNGAKLHAALVAFARRRDAALADWIADTVRVPGTMVDSITPASDLALSADVAAVLGVADLAPVQREAFVQWVVEDTGLAEDGPDFASVDVIVTSDVAGFERAKLRILNGAHSTLAYAGLLRGHASVAQAMADPLLADFIDALIRRDVMPMLPPVRGLDLDGYRQAVLGRFANPVIVHRLEQIAQDGTQKLPYRLGDTIDANRRAGRLPGHALAALGCWIAFVHRRAAQGIALVDPAARKLAEAAFDADPETLVRRLASLDLGVRAAWRDDKALIAAIAAAAADALDGDWTALIDRANKGSSR